ncbi:Sec-independent protein translocase subunit TatA [Streptomyces sp. NPDC005962]|uniref:Sec-independent protein translocase subunit TatA n=1 Tax=Streptomyces sp. NPDC005962 TaxID=3154466 RepID=UPI0033CB5F82
MFGRLGATEIILILIVVLLLFGAKKLPDMARSLGKSARILKSEAKAMKSDGQKDQNAPADPPNPGQDQSAHRTIQAAPGDVSSSRPVAEPSDTTKR